MTDTALSTGQGDPLARGVVTPEGVLVYVRLARVGERVAALTLDLVILIVGLVVGVLFVLRYADRVKKDPSASLVYDATVD